MAKYQIFGYLDIWQGAPNIAKWGILEKSTKNAAQTGHLRSVGHSNQKLSQKIDFREFHHVNPLEHLKWVARWNLCYFKFEEKKITRPSFTHLKSWFKRQSQNQNFLGVTLLFTVRLEG